MTVFTPEFKQFSVDRMNAQGKDIERWAEGDNPILAKICQKIIKAAQEVRKT